MSTREFEEEGEGGTRTAEEVGHDDAEAARGVLVREEAGVDELPAVDVRADDDDARGGLVAGDIGVDPADLGLAAHGGAGVQGAVDAVGAGHGGLGCLKNLE